LLIDSGRCAFRLATSKQRQAWTSALYCCGRNAADSSDAGNINREGGMPGLLEGWLGFYAVWDADQI
jgi:hypothetical protein